MLLEAHGVVQHMVDGLRATSSIKWQHPVAKWWLADLNTPLTWTADEPMTEGDAAAANCLKAFVSRAIWKLCAPWHVALDARSGPEAAQLM